MVLVGVSHLSAYPRDAACDLNLQLNWFHPLSTITENKNQSNVRGRRSKSELFTQGRASLTSEASLNEGKV